MTLRPARLEDTQTVYRWICDPQVRAAAFSSEPIPPETHAAWFARKLADPSSLYWIAEDPAGIPVGQVRIERGAEGAEISIVIGEAARGRGVGSAVLRLAGARYRSESGEQRLLAFVRADNPASTRAFEKAGFTRAGDAIIKGVAALRFVLSGSPRR